MVEIKRVLKLQEVKVSKNKVTISFVADKVHTQKTNIDDEINLLMEIVQQ